MSENLCTEFACVCNLSETYKYISVFTRTSKLILISNQQHHQNGIQVHVSRCEVFSWRAKQVNLQWEQWTCGCWSGKDDLHCLCWQQRWGAADTLGLSCARHSAIALQRRFSPAPASEASASSQQQRSNSQVGAHSLPKELYYIGCTAQLNG